MIKARACRRRSAIGGPQFLARSAALHLAQESRFRRDRGHPLDQAPDPCASRAIGEIAVAGHNIKLGRGGIREIEFFAQTQQLIWGGRDRELRVAGDLRGAATPGRRGPHRPGDGRRMIDGLSLSAPCRASPADDRGRADPDPARRPARSSRRSRRFCGSSRDSADFVADAAAPSGHGRRPLCRAVRGGPDARRARGNLVFTGIEDDPGDAARRWRELGFADRRLGRGRDPRLASRPHPRHAQPRGRARC